MLTRALILLAFPTSWMLAPPPQEELRDFSKSRIEVSLERALLPAAPVQPGTVAPGLVPWHASFDEACAVARRSGKPVLLFQLLGRLDEEFC
jgi:hypothetical protein